MQTHFFFHACVTTSTITSVWDRTWKKDRINGVQTFTMNTSFSLGICIADSIRRPEWYHSLLRDQGALVVSSFGIRKKGGAIGGIR